MKNIFASVTIENTNFIAVERDMMNTELLHLHFPRTRKLTRTFFKRASVPNFAPVRKQPECDAYIKKKLPVQNCAGSFCILEDFRTGIKNIDIYSADIIVKKKLNTIRIKGHPQVTRGINKYLKDVPEFMHVFAPKQEYKGGLARHVLSVFQELLCHPEYQKASSRYKNILENVVLNHDTGKAIDLKTDHPEYSAKIISKRLKSLPIQKEDVDLTLKLIRHHHYSENIAKGRMTYEEYAKIFTEEEFNLIKIITDCDIKSKKGDIQYRLDENEIFFAEQAKVYRKIRENRKFN